MNFLRFSDNIACSWGCDSACTLCHFAKLIKFQQVYLIQLCDTFLNDSLVNSSQYCYMAFLVRKHFRLCLYVSFTFYESSLISQNEFFTLHI